MKVTFKFKPKATAAERQRLLGQLKDQAVTSVRPLFPDDPDAELASLFIAECSAEAGCKRAIEFLKDSAAVEYAEPEARRKLIR
jgi:hypothetical protein